MSARVSVVIPAYNHVRFIDEALDSVLGSAYDDLEVVVVDDGSTDGTRARLDARSSEPRLRLLTQPNRGAHDALTRGIAATSGDILFILNSDDAYHAERIPRLVRALEDNPGWSLATSWLDVRDGSGNPLGVKRGWSNMPPWPTRAGRRLSQLGEPALALLEVNFVATTSNVAFRRALVERHGLAFRPLRYTHDWDFLLTATAHGEVGVVPEPLVRYRVHGANTIGEGRQNAAGLGLMRFEILWVLAQHSLAVRRRYEDRYGRRNLASRQRGSLPPFIAPLLFAQMAQLRGGDPGGSAAFEELLLSRSPLRRALVNRFSRGEPVAQT